MASRLGVDAKTLRKFFRLPSTPYKPVGQGRRYEFTEAEFEEIKIAFAAWSGGKKTKPIYIPPGEKGSTR